MTKQNIKFIENDTPFFLRPAPIAVRASACLGTIFFYLITKYVLVSYLPRKWFVDSQKMYRIMDGVEGIEGGSFAVTAQLYSMFPVWCHNLLVVVIAIVCIILTFRAAQTWRGIILSFLVLLPMLPLVLLVPSKEPIVVLMAFIVLGASRIGKSTVFLILSIIIFYIVYGLNVRIYYLLILGVWLGIIIFPLIPKPVTILILIVGIIVFFLLPPEIFQALQGPRDQVYHFVKYVLGADHRTSIKNPFSPDAPIAFIGNYLFAIVVLNFPFFMFFGLKELILFINVLIYLWLTTKGWHSADKKIQILTKLFVSHVLVLWLFEPDLGSYFRHFSSVFVFLIPILSCTEESSKNKGAHHQTKHCSF